MKFVSLLASVYLSIALSKATPFPAPQLELPAVIAELGLISPSGTTTANGVPTAQAKSDSSESQDTSDTSDTTDTSDDSDTSDSTDAQDSDDSADAQDASDDDDTEGSAYNVHNQDNAKTVHSQSTAQATGDNPTEKQILQLMLYVKQLKSAFYTKFLADHALADFTAGGYTANNRGSIKQMGQHEAKHVTLLSNLLGPMDTFSPCTTYTFASSTPTVRQYIDLAMQLEGVTAAGFVTALPKITAAQPFYQTAMAAMADQDARHASYLQNPITSKNTMGFTSPAVPDSFPWSNAYETHLTLSEVYSYLKQYTSSCATPVTNLPFKSITALTATPASGNTFTAGMNVQLAWTGSGSAPTGIQMAVYNGYNMTYVPIDSNKMAKLPSNFQGYGYVAVSKQNKDADSNMIAGPAVVKVVLDSSSNN